MSALLRVKLSLRGEEEVWSIIAQVQFLGTHGNWKLIFNLYYHMKTILSNIWNIFINDKQLKVIVRL
jgi:hypothetical protein